jgi:hypothetical protein
MAWGQGFKLNDAEVLPSGSMAIKCSIPGHGCKCARTYTASQLRAWSLGNGQDEAKAWLFLGISRDSEGHKELSKPLISMQREGITLAERFASMSASASSSAGPAVSGKAGSSRS